MSTPSKFEVMRANRREHEARERRARDAHYRATAPAPAPMAQVIITSRRSPGWLSRAFDWTMGFR